MRQVVGGGSSKAVSKAGRQAGRHASSSSVWSVEVVSAVVVGSDMDSVERERERGRGREGGEKKNEEMGSLCTCFQGNRGLQNTGRLDFLFSMLHCPLAGYCRPL